MSGDHLSYIEGACGCRSERVKTTDLGMSRRIFSLIVSLVCLFNERVAAVVHNPENTLHSYSYHYTRACYDATNNLGLAPK